MPQSHESAPAVPFDYALKHTAEHLTESDLQACRNKLPQKWQATFDKLSLEKKRLLATLDMMSPEELKALTEAAKSDKNRSAVGSAGELNELLFLLNIYRETSE